MKPQPSHRFDTRVEWKGGTVGAVHGGAPAIGFGLPVAFGGADSAAWTPESLLVAAVEACTMLTFFAYARRRSVKVLSYESTASGVLSSDPPGGMRFTQLTVRPVVRVATQRDADEANELFRALPKRCFVGASLKAEPIIEARVEVSAESEMQVPAH